jgi:hypothetical protein
VPQLTVICTIVGEWGTLIQQPSSPILIHHNQSWKAETVVCKWVSTKGQNPKHGGSSWTLTITHYFLTITDSNWLGCHLASFTANTEPAITFFYCFQHCLPCQALHTPWVFGWLAVTSVSHIMFSCDLRRTSWTWNTSTNTFWYKCYICNITPLLATDIHYT